LAAAALTLIISFYIWKLLGMRIEATLDFVLNYFFGMKNEATSNSEWSNP
jgi:hypothetical protein